MSKTFGIFTEERQHVMVQHGERIAPIVFAVTSYELESLPVGMHNALVNRRYRNIAAGYGLDPDTHMCLEVSQQ